MRSRVASFAVPGSPPRRRSQSPPPLPLMLVPRLFAWTCGESQQPRLHLCRGGCHRQSRHHRQSKSRHNRSRRDDRHHGTCSKVTMLCDGRATMRGGRAVIGVIAYRNGSYARSGRGELVSAPSPPTLVQPAAQPVPSPVLQPAPSPAPSPLRRSTLPTSSKPAPPRPQRHHRGQRQQHPRSDRRQRRRLRRKLTLRRLELWSSAGQCRG